MVPVALGRGLTLFPFVFSRCLLCVPPILDLKMKIQTEMFFLSGSKRSHVCVCACVWARTCVCTPLSESLWVCGFVSIRALLILSDKKKEKKNLKFQSFSLSLSCLLFIKPGLFLNQAFHIAGQPPAWCSHMIHNTFTTFAVCSSSVAKHTHVRTHTHTHTMGNPEKKDLCFKYR